MPPPMSDWQRRVWEIVEVASPDDRPSRIFDTIILGLILLSAVAVVVSTMPSVHARFHREFRILEVGTILVFSLEYVLRVSACTADPRYRHPVGGRLRFMVTPLAVIDLLAVLPFYLPLLGVDLRVVRLLRMIRLVRLAKLGRYYSSLHLISRVVRDKREELILSTVVMLVLLFLSSTLMYYCEADAQPDAFGSIPSTMWWAVATLTTVGYGDVTPVTPLGRLFASLVAALGIGMFALPTGILGAGFVSEIERRKAPPRCPHCGEPLR